MRKKVYGYCDGGLGNRLGALLGAMNLSKRLDADYEILWPQTRWCGCLFDDLFEGNLSFINIEKSMSDFVKEKNITLQNSHIKFDFPDTEYVHPEGDLNYNFNNHQNIIYNNHSTPSYIHENDVINLLSELKIKKEILDELNLFISNNNINDEVLGVHIRKTDNPMKLSDELYVRFVRDNQHKRIFVCSDDEEIEKRLKNEFSNVITRTKKDYVQKFIEGDWRIGDYFNVTRSRDSVIDAFLDMLILSRTNIASKPNTSSFLTFAIRYNKIKL